MKTQEKVGAVQNGEENCGDLTVSEGATGKTQGGSSLGSAVTAQGVMGSNSRKFTLDIRKKMLTVRVGRF